jgi:tRNA(Ile)-lysidine synthase
LLAAWKHLALPCADASIILAVSGGADSTAMLLAIHELIESRRLQINPVVAHLDHSLRRESKADAIWVRKLAEKLGYQSEHKRVDVGKLAETTGDNLEQAARRARYDFLLRSAAKRTAGVILTAHTLDDQAETVLLRLLRGSGADGLAGIEPLRRASPASDILLARPLVTWARRSDTEEYCRQRKIEYRSDPMNEDEQFDRVRVRRQLIPLMESFNPKTIETLARTAELLRDELDVLNTMADLLLKKASDRVKGDTTVPALDVRVMAEAPIAVRRRALRQWISAARGDLRRCELAHIKGIEKLLSGEQGGRVAELPAGDKVMRKRSRIEFVVKKHLKSR